MIIILDKCINSSSILIMYLKLNYFTHKVDLFYNCYSVSAKYSYYFKNDVNTFITLGKIMLIFNLNNDK